jgi:rhamnosyltransferase
MPNHGIVFSAAKMMEQIQPAPGQEYYECDVAMWSGSLYRLDAVRAIGFPSADYFADWVEIEYGYRGKRHGYRAFVSLTSILVHNVGGQSMMFTSHRVGPFAVRTFEFLPLRCYYETRNRLYFWLHEYKEGDWVFVRRSLVAAVRFTANFLVRPRTHKKQIAACLRGMRDGIFGRMHHRY